ncbi:MAG TPA: iron ABC transporter permease [Coleofasciculaceae cyanobacterium]|jgi:iron(III) transport system permease protein
MLKTFAKPTQLQNNPLWIQQAAPGIWMLLVGAIALLLSVPVMFVISHLVGRPSAVWQHLATTVLSTYILNSVGLMVGVGCGVMAIGVSTAALVTLCSFPGRRIFEWLLLLPLAAPAYILAYVYTEILEFYGPVQSGLRAVMGWQTLADYWFPNIRSLGGAIAMLTLVLYPYVYLLARVAFLEQSVHMLEASRSLGYSPWRSFLKVVLPLARPAIAAGTALALMETLSDFGTVEFFGVGTFTTGIYRTWFALGDRGAACQLAACLLLFIFALLAVERWFRQRAKYYQTNSRQPFPRYRLQGVRGAIAQMTCALPILLGFALPMSVLLNLSWNSLSKQTGATTQAFWDFAKHSLILAGLTAGLGVAIALLMAYGLRLYPSRGMNFAVRFAAMGYAIPGSVIAVGVLVPVGQFDNAIDRWMQSTFNVSTGLLLSGTIAALVFAYLVRFLAVSFGTVESSLGRVKPSLDEAARSLGCSPAQTLVKIHAPLMSGGLLTAALLVFVDVMKELPATLIVRPFNFDTLAIRVYRLASDERLAEAAIPAMAIVVAGLIPIALLTWQIQQTRRSFN